MSDFLGSLTWIHFVSLDPIGSELDSPGLKWSRLNSVGLIWIPLDSVGLADLLGLACFYLVPLGNKVSLGPTRSPLMVSLHHLIAYRLSHLSLLVYPRHLTYLTSIYLRYLYDGLIWETYLDSRRLT